jgi:hypothetical protein
MVKKETTHAAKHGLPAWDDNTYYEIQLLRSTTNPTDALKVFPAGAKLTVKGKLAKLLNQEDIANAKPI